MRAYSAHRHQQVWSYRSALRLTMVRAMANAAMVRANAFMLRWRSITLEHAHHNGGMLASCPSRRLPASCRPSRGVCGWRAQSRSSCREKTMVPCAIPPALLIDRRYLSHKYLASSWVVCMWSSFSSNGPNYLHQQLNRGQWCAPQPSQTRQVWAAT